MEQGLVERAQAGDHDAFSVLVRRSYPRLYGVAKLILRDQDGAQDAVQEAMVESWRHIRALRDPGAWDAWLYRMTVRACYRSARKSRRRDAVELQVDATGTSTVVADASHAVSERDRIARVLDRLPVDQRAVMVLRYFADLSLDEAADVLGVPVGTVKSRIHRGLAAMRLAMSAEPEAQLGLISERQA